MRIKFMDRFTDFGKGAIAGFLLAAIVFGFVIGIMHHRMKLREVVEYVERQQVIEAMREDYVNRDPFEFLETIPGVRGAADNAITEFERNRDEILLRFRSGIVD